LIVEAATVKPVGWSVVLGFRKLKPKRAIPQPGAGLLRQMRQPVVRPFSIAINRRLHFNVASGLGQTSEATDQPSRCFNRQMTRRLETAFRAIAEWVNLGKWARRGQLYLHWTANRISC
jgi:hypothetical protein